MADKSDSLINENCSRADAASGSEADVMDLMSASASDEDAVETVKKRRPDKHRDRHNNSSDCAVPESGATNKRKAVHAEFISDDADGDGVEQSDRDGEEYDAASKLLMSIQVLPRIPKKKQVVDEDVKSAAECSKPYRSVLERAGSANNRSLGSLTNWSTSGWTRGNDVNIQGSKAKRKDHDHKDRVGLSKWVKDRPPSSSYSNSKPEDKKTLTKAPVASTLSENRHETQKVSGPLPTLPFEEQMRERARLRALQMSESSKVCAAGALFDAVIGQPSNESNRKSLYELDIASCSDTNNSRMNVTDISSSPAPGSLSNVSAENDISDDSTDMRTKQLSKVVKSTEIDRLKRIEHASISSKTHDHSVQQIHKADNGSISSDSRQLLTKSDPPSPPLPVLPILPLFASICSTTVTDSVVSTVNKSSKLMNLPLLAAVPGNTESLPNMSAAPDVIEGQSTAKAVASNGSKTVTFNCPEDDSKEKKSKSKKHVKNHKRESKANVQQQIIDEMKNYLRPYYVRRQITKDEYKDIMRRAVPRICRRQSNQPSMSASHVHKYADAYVDSVLKRRQGKSTKQDSTVKSKQSSSQQRLVADQLPAKNV